MSKYKMNPTTEKRYKRLSAIRKKKGLAIKRKPPNLRETFVGFDGVERPLKIRDYQVIGILHMASMGRFILGDDTGLGKCTRGDTLIRTGSNGLVPIEDINPGITKPDTFAPVDHWSVQVGGKELQVSQFYHGGVKPTRKVQTHHGFEIEGSLVHPVRVRRGGGEVWVKLAEVREGDYLCIDRSPYKFGRVPVSLPSEVARNGEKTYPTQFKMVPELARFLGYLIAEGWFNHKDGEGWFNHKDGRFFTISQCSLSNPETSADIEYLIDTLFKYPVRKHGNDYPIASTYLIRWLEAIGVPKGVAKDKCIPWSVLRADRECVRQFVRALVDAESHVTKNGIEFSSASEKLAKQLQIVLLGFGVVSRRSPKAVKGRDHTYWRLTILGEDARVFMEHVGLISQRKRDAILPLTQHKENTNHDVVPHLKPEVEALREEIYARCGRQGYKGGGTSKRFGNAFYTTLGHVRAGRRNVSYSFLDTMLGVALEVGVPQDSPSLLELSRVRQREWFYDPVRNIERGEAEVYDITVDDPSHCYVGNGVVNHNTLSTIASLCVLWRTNPDQKALILTTKSAVPQWAGEFQKFTTGVHVTAMTGGNPKKREKQYAEFLAEKGPAVIVMNYALARADFTKIHGELDFRVVVYDEATAFKNPRARIHQVCKALAQKEGVAWVWGLTATLIKNNLIEGYGIYKVVMPPLFGTKTSFMKDYCITRLQKLPKSGRQIPVIIGYRDEDIERFRRVIDPFFLGRPKHEVATELPNVTFRMLKFSMHGDQTRLYSEALSGLLWVQDKETGEMEQKEVDHLTACTRLQQIVNHPELLGRDGKSKKFSLLKDLLSEGDLADEKVIVFTRFAEMVKLIMPALNNTDERRKNRYAVSITGHDSNPKRRAEAQRLFQDPNSDTKVIVITTAGSDAINLQAAKGLICYDTPWSAGDYLQLLGRMVRIGSQHDRVYAIHLCGIGSIDMRVNQVLRKKMDLVEAVLGRRIKGESKPVTISADGDLKAIYEGVLEDARKSRRKK